MNKLKKFVIATGLILSMSAFTLNGQTEAATTTHMSNQVNPTIKSHKLWCSSKIINAGKPCNQFLSFSR